MYYDALKLFHKNFISECNKVSSYLDNNDLKNFSISIHAMKSELSTIGAMKLSQMAFKLETASKNAEIDYCMKEFPRFKKELLSLDEQLSAALRNARK